jgi:hypothetical protein
VRRDGKSDSAWRAGSDAPEAGAEHAAAAPPAKARRHRKRAAGGAESAPAASPKARRRRDGKPAVALTLPASD